MVSLLWFSIYSSESADEHFVQGLKSSGGSEFVYERPTPLGTAALEKLCEHKRLKVLKQANLSGNDVRHLWEIGLFNKDTPFPAERLDLSFNGLEKIDRGLEFAPNLIWLDLSHNPLQTITIAPGALTKLRILRMQGTLLDEVSRQALQRRLPNTQIEF